MTSGIVKPFFLNSSAGRIFLLMRAPENPKGCVLFVPAFAEEMNKSRRQVTETAFELTKLGLSVLLVDLFGTGDSDGDFADAQWDTWKSDISNAIDWAASTGVPVSSLIATRLGCALAVAGLRQAGHSVANTIFWQPVSNGRQAMTQLLRLRVAASMMEEGAKETVESLKKQLAAGNSLEVAGYQLSPRLWRDIEPIKLTALLDSALGSLDIIEIGRVGADLLSASGRRLVDAAEARGIRVSGQRISGDPFWSATEIVVNPQLTDTTIQLMTESVKA